MKHRFHILLICGLSIASLADVPQAFAGNFDGSATSSLWAKQRNLQTRQNQIFYQQQQQQRAQMLRQNRPINTQQIPFLRSQANVRTAKPVVRSASAAKPKSKATKSIWATQPSKRPAVKAAAPH